MQAISFQEEGHILLPCGLLDAFWGLPGMKIVHIQAKTEFK